MDDRRAGGQGDALRIRGDAQVPQEVRAYMRAKVEAVTGALGLGAASGEVRLTPPLPAGAGRPWTAVAQIQVPGGTVVCRASAATGWEVTDLLHDRLRRLVEREVHAHREGRTAITAPPWRTTPASDAGTPVPDRD